MHVSDPFRLLYPVFVTPILHMVVTLKFPPLKTHYSKLKTPDSPRLNLLISSEEDKGKSEHFYMTGMSRVTGHNACISIR